MIVLAFAFFIRVFTSFQNLSWGLVFAFGAIVLTGLISLFSKNKQKSLKSGLMAVVLGFLGAMIACGTFRWRNNPAILSAFFSFSFFHQPIPSQTSYLIDDFLVLEQTKPDRYILQNLKDHQHYTLKTNQALTLGKVYYLGARKVPLDLGKTYGSRFFAEQKPFFEKLADFLSYEFSFEKRMLMKGYAGSLFPKFIFPSAHNPQLPRWEKGILSARSSLKSLVTKHFPDRNGGLLLGMLIGERSALANQDYQNFITSGIVHIIAVSGGNLVMIMVFLGGVLFFLPFYLRNAVILLGVIAFAMIAGGDSSIVRALVMAVLSLLALFRGREVEIRRLMRYAFVLMLFWNPYFLAYDLGFLLSFGALIGIVLLSKLLENPLDQQVQKNKKIRFGLLRLFWKNYGIPTLGAMIGTLPILLFFIGKTNFLGTLVNLIVVPLVPFLTIGGFFGIVLVEITAWERFLLPINWGLDLMFRLSERAVKYAVSIQISHMRVKWLLLLLLGGILRCLWKMVDEGKSD